MWKIILHRHSLFILINNGLQSFVASGNPARMGAKALILKNATEVTDIFRGQRVRYGDNCIVDLVGWHEDCDAT